MANVRRQPLQRVVVQPEFLQCGQSAQKGGQHVDFVVAQIQTLQLDQLTERGGQCAQQILAQLERFELGETVWEGKGRYVKLEILG